MPRVADKLRAYDYALKETSLKHSKHKNERAMRFQIWVDESWTGGTSPGSLKFAWQRYERELSRVRVRCDHARDYTSAPPVAA